MVPNRISLTHLRRFSESAASRVVQIEAADVVHVEVRRMQLDDVFVAGERAAVLRRHDGHVDPRRPASLRGTAVTEPATSH